MVTKGADPESPALAEIVVVDDLESESEVEDPGPEVVAELAPLQKEVSSWST